MNIKEIQEEIVDEFSMFEDCLLKWSGVSLPVQAQNCSGDPEECQCQCCAHRYE